MAERARAKAKADFWKEEKAGDSIEGVVININHNMGDYGSTHYHVRKDDGEVLIVSVSPQSVLGGKLDGEHVEIGDRIYVEFLGERKSKKGKTYKDWATDCEHAVQPTPAQGNGKESSPDDDIPPF
jgi:hypothetical protein